MLQFKNVVKHFGSFSAVNDISLKINKGELFGFLGPNGAGKTTSIKMLTGLYSITRGSILIDNIDISKNPINAKKIFGYVPDQPYIYEKLTGLEYLYFCGGLYELPKSVIKNKIEELVEILQIGNWLNIRTESYSQGMKQRIIIASAFIHNPSLIIIDEPMVGLDPQSAHLVKKLLVDQTKLGKTVFMSTHSLNIVEEICTRVGIINNGKIIFDGEIEKLHSMKNELQSNFEELFIELTSEK